jgi:hypothetical protein
MARVKILISDIRSSKTDNEIQQNCFLYFAYGSNMLTARLHKRCPSARSLGKAVAPGFILRFWKRSKDGSAKATLVKTDEAEKRAYGVLFEIAQSERTRLDKSEGAGQGYNRDDAFPVLRVAGGKRAIVSTYQATPRACDKNLVPYDWYRDLILAGALQHGLPDAYVAELRKAVVRPDPEPQRKSRQEALDVLRCVGFQQPLQP